jgi:hypothetical protein
MRLGAKAPLAQHMGREIKRNIMPASEQRRGFDQPFQIPP